MPALLQTTFTSYLALLDQFGLLPSVILLMAMQSTVFPVPSEVVVPPATYLALRSWAQPPYLSMLVVAAVATLGCFIGAGSAYWVSRALGRPLVIKYGRYVLLSRAKLEIAERWVDRYGAAGIFFACLVPVVRSFHAIPAGITRMPFGRFSLMLITGSALWCSTLTVFGWLMSGSLQVLLESGEGVAAAQYKAAFRQLTLITLGLVALLVGLYIAVVRRHAVAPPGCPVDVPSTEG